MRDLPVTMTAASLTKSSICLLSLMSTILGRSAL